MNKINHNQNIEFLQGYCRFESDFDCYVLIAVARKKDNIGITNSQEVVFRQVIKNHDNIIKKYNKIISQCDSYRTDNGERLNFYVYISVNARDSKKAYIVFKRNLLHYESEMLNGVAMHNQLKRIDSVWLSSLMQPESRTKQRFFLIDIDTKDKAIIYSIESGIDLNIICKRETVHGWHYVVMPFNRNNWSGFSCMEVKNDALLFIEYIKGD